MDTIEHRVHKTHTIYTAYLPAASHKDMDWEVASVCVGPTVGVGGATVVKGNSSRQPHMLGWQHAGNPKCKIEWPH